MTKEEIINELAISIMARAFEVAPSYGGTDLYIKAYPIEWEASVNQAQEVYNIVDRAGCSITLKMQQPAKIGKYSVDDIKRGSRYRITENTELTVLSVAKPKLGLGILYVDYTFNTGDFCTDFNSVPIYKFLRMVNLAD